MPRIMTLNIHGFNDCYGPWEQRRELIRAVIREARPDVVAMQAVEREAGGEARDQAWQLCHASPGLIYSVFQPAKTLDDGFAAGLAFLSRTRPDVLETVGLQRLEQAGEPTERIFVHGRFDFAGWPLNVVNAYVSWIEAQALQNVDEIIGYLGRYAEEPCLLVGDFNNSAEALPMQTIKTAGFHDLWAELHPAEPGFTFFEDGGKRIDYVWANRFALERVMAMELVANCDDPEGLRPSNHLGLLVTLA